MTAQTAQSPLAGGQSADQNRNTATVAPAQKTGNNFAILKAKFALAGHTVIVTDRDDFLVCRWGLVRYCQNFAALEAFARQVGVINHG